MPRLELEPEKIERGLVKLVLTLVEMIRQLMEKQAMHRIDVGGLNDEEVDRLGRTLMQLEAKMTELRARFDIDDLNIDLGPLGCLLDEAE